MSIQETPPGIGHNLAPDPIGDTLKPLVDLGEAKLTDRIASLVKAANIWKTKVPEIKDADTAAAAEDFLAQLRAEYKAVDAVRAEAKKPHDDAAKRVQEAFRPALALIEACGNALKPLKAAWLKKEEDRIAAERRKAAEDAAAAEERARQLAQDAAAKDAPVEAQIATQAAAQTAEDTARAAAQAEKAKATVAGNYTARASGFRSRWIASIEDWKLAAAHYSNDSGVREAIQKAANRDATAQKGAMNIPGCKPREEKTV